jgi:hypothetical protein
MSDEEDEELAAEERREERLKWALREVHAGRGVILNPPPIWGMYFKCCTKCGFVHVNPLKIRFFCARCRHFGKGGDVPPPESPTPWKKRSLVDVAAMPFLWWLRLLSWPFNRADQMSTGVGGVAGFFLAVVWWPVWLVLTLVGPIALLRWLF